MVMPRPVLTACWHRSTSQAIDNNVYGCRGVIREMKSVSTPAFSMAFSMAFSRAFFRAYFALAFALYVGLISPSHADPLADAITETKANIVFMRHALAPGYGDPAHFDIRDCTTQRNLDAVGLKQAELTGAWLRDQGFVFDTIFSSAWCRCMDTAMALYLGQWRRRLYQRLRG